MGVLVAPGLGSGLVVGFITCFGALTGVENLLGGSIGVFLTDIEVTLVSNDTRRSLGVPFVYGLSFPSLEEPDGDDRAGELEWERDDFSADFLPDGMKGVDD